jgi:hypothetical protein
MGRDGPVAVLDHEWLLAFERYLLRSEFQAERVSVRQFGKTGTQGFVHGDATVHCLGNALFGLIIQRRKYSKHHVLRRVVALVASSR